MTFLGFSELIVTMSVVAVPTLLICPRIAFRSGLLGEGMLTGIAKGWWRATFLISVAISAVSIAVIVMTGAPSGSGDWVAALFAGPIIAFIVIGIAAIFPSIIGGFIAYNFGAQRRAREALADLRSQASRP